MIKATPSQLGMNEMLGFDTGDFPTTVKERVIAGHSFLVKITGQDIGFDPEKWDSYLRETNAGGYRWRDYHLHFSEQLLRARQNSEWCEAIEELCSNQK